MSSLHEATAPDVGCVPRAAASTLAALGSPVGDAERSACTGAGEEREARRAYPLHEPRDDEGTDHEARKAGTLLETDGSSDPGEAQGACVYNGGDGSGARVAADVAGVEGGRCARKAGTLLERSGSINTGTGEVQRDDGRADAQSPPGDSVTKGYHGARGGTNDGGGDQRASFYNRGSGVADGADAQQLAAAACEQDWGVGGEAPGTIRMFFTCASVGGKWGSAATAVSEKGAMLWSVERRAEQGTELAAGVRALLAGLQELVERGGGAKCLEMWTDLSDAVDVMNGGVQGDVATKHLVSEATAALRDWKKGGKGRAAQYGCTDTENEHMNATFRRAKEALERSDEQVAVAASTARSLASLLNPFMKGTVECGGGGDCMFKALSHALIGSTDWHGELRRRAAQHIRENLAEYGAFIDECTPDEYADTVEKQGTWVGHLAARAVADATQTPHLYIRRGT